MGEVILSTQQGGRLWQYYSTSQKQKYRKTKKHFHHRGTENTEKKQKLDVKNKTPGLSL
jgi:hypothetical protein